MSEWGTTPQSASERWWVHYRDCQWCQVHDIDPRKDRFCAQGYKLRNEMIRDYEASEPRGDTAALGWRGDSRGSGPKLVVMSDGPLFCVLCQEPLLPFPVFWIDKHHDGIHDACDEQRLAEEEADCRGVGLI